MILTSRLYDQVSSRSRQRGIPYYRSGAVRILEGDANQVVATVHGTDTYEVTLERDDSSIIAACTCPYVEEHNRPCKHIWATLLSAEEKGYLQGDKGEPPTEIYVDLGDDGEFYEDEFD